MAGVELNPGPITPGDEKSVEKQEQPIPAPSQTLSGDKTVVKQEKPIPDPAQNHWSLQLRYFMFFITMVYHFFVNLFNYEKTGVKQKPIHASAQTPSEQGVSLVTEETEAKQYSEARQEPSVTSAQSPQELAAPFMQPLGEPELVEFAEFITPENQERIAVMLGSNLDKVEMLRCKHRENVTAVSVDLLIDWMRCNPQPTNRLVS